jgi:hypothetical protein
MSAPRARSMRLTTWWKGSGKYCRGGRGLAGGRTRGGREDRPGCDRIQPLECNVVAGKPEVLTRRERFSGW